MLNIIQTQYPDALPILQKPGVAAVYVQYLTAQPPWTTAQLQAALRATPYYQTSPQAVRDYDILQATDPATAGTKGELVKRQIDDLEKQLGITLDNSAGFGSPKFAFFVDALKNGWDANEIKYRMLASVNAMSGGGAVGKSAADVKNLANQYAVPLSDQTVMDYARKLEQGAIDQNGLQGYMIEQAKQLFPGMASALDKGVTVKQYVDPLIQIAQQEVGLNPATVNLTDQKWMKVLNQVDPKTGERTPMTADQALTTFRTDPAWGFDQTNKAHQDATQLATQLAQKFGAQ